MNPSPQPRRVRTPGWFDPRLVAGIGLILISVVVGAVVVSSADRTERVWSSTRPLAAGVVLTNADLRPVSVRMPDLAGYFKTASDPSGQTLTSAVGAGELLPRSAVGPTSSRTTITIPLSDDHAPKIAAGDRITLWLSTKLCPAATVLSDSAVQEVRTTGAAGFGVGGGEALVVRLTAPDAARVVRALSFSDAVIWAGVLDGPVSPPQALPDLAACGSSTS